MPTDCAESQRMSAASPAGGLLLGNEDGAFGLTGGRGLHRRRRWSSRCGSNDECASAKIVPLHQRRENVGEQKIGNGFQLISGGQVAGDLHAQFAKMLHRPPDFGARRAKFLGNASAADDDGGVVAQQADDAAEPRVGGVIAVRVNASWGNARDTRIMPSHSRKSSTGDRGPSTPHSQKARMLRSG